MKTKSNVEFNVLGSFALDGKQYFICKLDSPRYYQGVLHSHILLPAHEFNVSNGDEWAEIIHPNKDEEKQQESHNE
jgi:hypothetical protein